MANELAEGSSSAAPSEPVDANLEFPVTEQLAVLHQKGSKGRSKTFRAFLYGSAAVFRKAAGSGEFNAKDISSKAHKEPISHELCDIEQACLANAQMTEGIGSSIYRGRFFRSSDNQSISSTASSASAMVRKMRYGMKQSTRSLVGLFRTKSGIGIPSAKAIAPTAGHATAHMTAVGADTLPVHVDSGPFARSGGMRSARLERNSPDAIQLPQKTWELPRSGGFDKLAQRKTTVNGDQKQTDLLAAQFKGLKERKLISMPQIAVTGMAVLRQ